MSKETLLPLEAECATITPDKLAQSMGAIVLVKCQRDEGCSTPDWCSSMNQCDPSVKVDSPPLTAELAEAGIPT